MRYAAIDIGSNAVRLLIADIIQNTGSVSFKKNTLIRVPLRLGDDAFIQQHISEKKTTELVKSMVAFRNLMDVYKVTDYLACATSAMREAKNGEDVVKLIKDEANIDIEIVHGSKEASIIYASHAEQNIDKSKNYLYIDVGGGSTELSLFSAGELIVSRSFNIGTIRILDNQDTEETWNEMKDFVRDNTRNFKQLSGIGTGGNINKLFRLSEEKEDMPLTFAKLRSLYTYLSSFSLKDRINVLGLNQDRADVIIPACEIYLTVMKNANIKNIYVPRVGMVDGIIQTLIEKNIQ
ncbi:MULTISPECIES: Ppx/GppA phosphatase family protein [Mucilaginibacter]|uniref:Ethanolamine ammonia-lyase reactivating factor EutA n=3 Tax=Mucilaginibacter TaxID=423349 RepID=A0AAE6JE01_9SPHI|nr:MULTISPECIES: ethanolamine ammonia-lyase reactivating factor EutA [Mucilaginibacter]NVM67632.1 exopolyphosphatase/guanosine-5'-triphosphate,3'-diphosphate pyrophosphatase [Mucilaginibacter sp. SG538B]QEM03959.1 exopolyphosphatase [Mucilaginibacter rubeus]QEM16568.1 exopolyphosphatase [Mucilaginibacter gossypii]QTE40658.1 ethanolamine ammonia-lyase reactivating factor EutA [Mucilaginibacter rubeus]QTE47260.1 ethanolamine ammonia-lyase reactivating factor EutA [Mucilaginibacter rubeus]